MTQHRMGWDWQTDRIYPPHRGPLPTVQLVRHHHMCPDGTVVEVTAQHISQTGITLYRWKVGGQPAGTSSVAGPASVPPDWSTVDGEHAATGCLV